jgi:hypothetical protein
VPNAWATLASLPWDYETAPFYPASSPWPGPTAEPLNEVGILITTVALWTSGNTYVQPARQPPLNTEPPLQVLKSYTAPPDKPVQQFLEQVGYQHWSDTYLRLLGLLDAQLPTPAVPAVASVSPTSGNWGTSVTILPPSGSTFTSDCVVDFGGFAAASQTVASGGTSITAVSPLGFGTVDIRVTNMFGTSAAGSGDKFTFTL